jgi:hypothetical protein
MEKGRIYRAVYPTRARKYTREMWEERECFRDKEADVSTRDERAEVYIYCIFS